VKLRINGEDRQVDAGIYLADLLRSLGQDPEGQPVAVAVNLEVVPRDEQSARLLKEGDRVDLVTAVGGG
jgi:thiamine biosynthesis protein ThiS